MKSFISRLFLLITAVASICSVALGTASWTYIDNTQYSEDIAETSVDINQTQEEPFVYYTYNNVTYYCKTINEAIASAEDKRMGTSNSVSIYVHAYSKPYCRVYEESSDIVINSGVKLIFLYEQTKHLPAESEVPTLPNTLIDTNQNNVNKYRKTVLKMTNGADIIINSGGTLTLGGEFNTKGVIGRYCEINLSVGSHIEVRGTFVNYGYVKENYSDYDNSFSDKETVLDNSTDSERYIRVYDGGKLETYINLWDGLNGGIAYNVYSANLCVFNTFDFSGLQTFVQFDYGSKMDAYGVFSISKTVARSPTTCVSKVGGSSNSMFFMSEGSKLTMEYCPSSADSTKFTASSTITKISIYGSVTVGKVVFVVSGYDIDSSSFFLPISYKMNIYLMPNSTFTTQYRIKFMNGSQLYLFNDSRFVVSSDVVFHTLETWNVIKNSSTMSTNINYTYSGDDSHLKNNGTIEVTSKGKLGAYIEHTSPDCTGELDFSKSGSLSATSKEGTGGGTITIDSNGDYFDGSAMKNGKFIGGRTYSAAYDETKTPKFYWSGTFTTTVTLSIECEKLGYKYPIQDWVLSVVGQETRKGTSDAAYSLTIGDQFKFDAHRALSVLITLNGEEVSYSTSTTYTINNDSTIVVTPKEGMRVDVGGSISDSKVGSDTSSDNSGCGQMSWRVKEGSETLFDQISNNGHIADVAVGLTYSIKCTGKGTNSSFKTVEPNGKYYTTTDGVAGSVGNWNPYNEERSFTATNSYKYIKYTFGCKVAGSVCVADDTLITLADNSTKMIKDVKSGELIKTFDFFKGEYVVQPVGAVVNHGYELNTIIKADFSNGHTIEMINEHGLYDYDLKELVTFDADCGNRYVGHRFIMEDNGQIVPSTLIGVSYEQRYCEAWSIFTYGTLNAVTNGILSTNSALPITRLITELDDGFKYNNDNLTALIDAYGYSSYAEWAQYLDEYTYNAFNFEYVNLYIGQGITTVDELLWWIEWFYELAGEDLVQ